jgi:type II secretion system protein H
VRRARGFTLIEVIVVLFVLALATAVVVPGIGRGTEALRARAEVAGFSAFLRYAREQAITRRRPQEVRIDPEARLIVLAEAGSDTVRRSRRIAPEMRIAAASASLTVRFLPEGVSTGATYRLEAPGHRIYEVTVDPLTGRVVNRRLDA